MLKTILAILISGLLSVSVCNADHMTPPKKITPTEALIFGISSGSKELITLAVSNGADVNARDEKHRSALYHAVYHNDRDLAILLLEKGATKTDIYGFVNLSLMHIAALYGHADMISLLYNHGFSLEARAINQQTPLHLAVAHGHEKVVRILIDLGADVNALTKDGYNALFIAVAENNSTLTRILLKNGAVQKPLQNIQKTPLYMASMLGNETIIHLLCNYRDYDNHKPKNRRDTH